MNTTQTMTLILGPPGAGKSTYTKENFSSPLPPRLVINMDSLRKARGYEYEESIELDVLQLTLVMADHALSQKQNVVIDESVTTLTTSSALTAVARKHGAKVVMIELDTSLQLCWERRAATGFKLETFLKKMGQWVENRRGIMAQADIYALHPTEVDFEAPTHTSH